MTRKRPPPAPPAKRERARGVPETNAENRKGSTRSKVPPVPRSEAPAATGRPPIAINPNVVEGMAFAGSPDVEIAAFLGCSVDTLTRRFAENLAKGRAGRKVKLRKLQMRAAEKGNPTMLVWLGKVELGQRETVALSNPDGSPIVPTEVRVKLVRPDDRKP